MTRLPPISSLLSPPEPALLSDFGTQKSVSAESQSYTDHFAMGATKNSPSLQRALQPISPPVSPAILLQNQADNATASQTSHPTTSIPDPPLFPENSLKAEPTTESLFPRASDDLMRYKIRQHIARRDVPSKSGDPRHQRKPAALPTEDEYMTVVSFQSRVMELYNRDRTAYAKALAEQNDVDYKLIKGIQTKKPVAAPLEPAKAASVIKAPKMSRVGSSGKVQKPLAAKRAPARRPAATSTLKIIHTTPDEKAVPRKKTEDVDFDSLQDLSPPISTLDHGRALRTDWSATPLDLSQDPNRHLLHESEVALAGALRLSCATYLCSKRRIFIARVENLKRGKEFRKTDAQQACKIDVNKASRLWTAYDGVGWFNRDLFTGLSS